MNSAIMFFMTRRDIDEFESLIQQKGFDHVVSDSRQTLYYSGQEFMQFLQPRPSNDLLLDGRISLRTQRKNEDSQRCIKIYNSLRRWIKKNYGNDLVCYNAKTQTRESATPTAMWWISPRVERLMLEKLVVLKQSQNSFPVFEKA